jgi:TRAP-type transport system periplasmic protein
VQIKWYLGGIAGDEFTALDRVRRGQLDGEAGAMFCERLAPSMKVGRVVGLFQSREEWHYVMSRLLRDIDREMGQSGFVNLGIGSFGNITLFARGPLRTFTELKAQRFWTYDLDVITSAMMKEMGLQVVPATLEDGMRLLDENKIDGFAAVPTAALAFQWSARTRYFSDMPIGELPGCIVMAQRTFDALPLNYRKVLSDAVAKFVGRFHELGRMQDQALTGGLFARQGTQKVEANIELRSTFMSAARAARDKLAPSLVPPELLARTMGWLADYRAERRR